LSDLLDGVAPARPHRIVVVGGGFSGTVLVVHLLLRSAVPLAITMVDRSALPHRGVAYATSRAEHLLNVRAGDMSALVDDPGHFARWLAATGLPFSADDFAPRQAYGDYLAALFEHARKSRVHSSVACIRGHAASLKLDGNSVEAALDDGTILESDTVVLAMGNAPPALPRQLAELDENFVAQYAWMDSALDGLPDSGSVLILGSGLTAIDQVLELKAREFQGRIFLLSRRGMLPVVHRTGCGSWSPAWTRDLPGDLRSTVARLRDQIRLARSQGVDWRPVVDSLRPVTPRLWQSLSVSDRKRFLRHLRSYWEVSRHRMPPQSTAALRELMRSGQLSIIAGTLLSAEQHDDHVMISYRQRGTQAKSSIAVHRIINCIGPGFVPRSQDPLIEQLLKDGVARLDPVGLGIETTPEGALISASGVKLEQVYTIGPVRKASLWETTAVREIRMQAIELADLILEKSRTGSLIAEAEGIEAH
jgi:uncharacterized NAD(P)/FAD-binding protein YdhS